MLVWSVNFDLISSYVSKRIFGLIRGAGDTSPPDIWIARRPCGRGAGYSRIQDSRSQHWKYLDPSIIIELFDLVLKIFFYSQTPI